MIFFEFDHPMVQLKIVAGPTDFERVKLIGQGDVGKVYLVRLKSTRSLFAMKILSKTEMIARNKVSLVSALYKSSHTTKWIEYLMLFVIWQLKRCLTEREILATVDNPFIVTLYYCFQVPLPSHKSYPYKDIFL
jgi:protein-serine/threonine kinase